MKVKVTYGADTKAASNIHSYQALREYVDSSFGLSFAQYVIVQKIVQKDDQSANDQVIDIVSEQAFQQGRSIVQQKNQTCQRFEVQMLSPEQIQIQQQMQPNNNKVDPAHVQIDSNKFADLVQESQFDGVDEETRKFNLQNKANFLDDNDTDLAQSTMFEAVDLQQVQQMNAQQQKQEYQNNQQKSHEDDNDNDNFKSAWMSESQHLQMNKDSIEEYKDAVMEQPKPQPPLIPQPNQNQNVNMPQNSFMLTSQEQTAIEYTGFMDQIFDQKQRETMGMLLQMGYTDYQKNFGLVQQKNNNIDVIIDILSQQ